MALVDVVSGAEYVPTYEDKDGDWMLVGDVPWRSVFNRGAIITIHICCCKYKDQIV